MKKLLLYCLFFFFLSCFSHDIIPEKPFEDSVEVRMNDLESIVYNTHETVINTSKDTWFYASFVISIIAIIIAFVSYIIGKKTYQAQKQTMQNTKRLTPFDLRQSLRNISYKLIDNMSVLIFIESEEIYYPKPYNFQNMRINLDTLKLDTYDFDGIDIDGFRLLYLQLDHYNQYIERFIRTAEDPTHVEIISQDYKIIIYLLSSIYNLYEKTFTIKELKERTNFYKNKFDEEELIDAFYNKDKFSELIKKMVEEDNIKELEQKFQSFQNFQLNNVYSNYLLSTSISLSMIMPKNVDYNFLFIFKYLEKAYDYDNENVSTLCSACSKSIINKIEPDELNYTYAENNKKKYKIKSNNISAEFFNLIKKIAILKCHTYYADYRTAPSYNDEIDKQTYTTEYGGTLTWLDYPNYASLIHNLGDGNVYIELNSEAAACIIDTNDNFEEIVNKLKISKRNFPYRLKSINNFVCTNNESNGRTMISTYSVKESYAKEMLDDGLKEISWKIVIRLKDQLSLRIV